MGKINWGRVFLCGVLAGAVLGALLLVDVAIFGKDFVAAVEAAGGPSFPPTTPGWLAFYSLMWLLCGIWMMWLYAAIRPRYGPGPKTAAIAGLATSVFGVMADAVWASLGFIQPGVLVAPVLAAIPAIIVAAVVGAWPYKE